jgi:hypothetical protein
MYFVVCQLSTTKQLNHWTVKAPFDTPNNKITKLNIEQTKIGTPVLCGWSHVSVSRGSRSTVIVQLQSARIAESSRRKEGTVQLTAVHREAHAPPEGRGQRAGEARGGGVERKGKMRKSG